MSRGKTTAVLSTGDALRGRAKKKTKRRLGAASAAPETAAGLLNAKTCEMAAVML